MKKFFTSIKAVVVAMTTTAILASSIVSCSYDDSKIWDEINQIKKDLADLRAQVESDLKALTDIVNGQVTVKNVAQQQDGSTVVTLSDDTRITIYPKTEEVKLPEDIITIYEEGGVYYWATYDGIGNKQPITVGGKKVPVAEVAPQTQVNTETNAIEISFDGGKTWMTTGYSESVTDTIFTDIKVVYSDWQVDEEGNPLPLYCIITLNDGSTIKVGMQSARIIVPFDSLFVPYGTSTLIRIEAEDVADFMTQIPRGWTCDVKHIAKSDILELTFTSPSYDDVVAGSADSDGVAKLMVVYNNGSSAIASIKVSTNPATVNFTEEGVYVEAHYGTSYMLCGIIPSSRFKAPTMTGYCNNKLGGNDTDNSTKYVREVAFTTEENVKFIDYADIEPDGRGMVAGTEYIFWYVVPRTDADDNYYALENEMIACTYTHSVITFEVLEDGIGLFDVAIEFSAAGSLGYQLGYDVTEEFDAATTAAYYTENPDYLYFGHNEASYSGSFLGLFDPNLQALIPGTSYTAWCITKGTSAVILEDNVRNWEFSTKPFVDGGSIEVVSQNVVAEYTRLSMDLTTSGHVAIYYNIMASNKATAYPDDAMRKEMLLRDGTRVITDQTVSVKYEKAKAGEKFTLFAMAVDTDGKFGKVLVQEYATKDYEYNNLALTATLTDDYKVDNTKIAVSCEGASKYVYVYTRTSTDDWTEMGGTKKKVGEFMMANPTDSRICDTSKAAYALQDGKICLNGLTMDEEYALVVMAIAADGSYSEPQAVYFKPIANIGIMVKKTDANWAEGKPEIIMGETTEVEFFNFVWYTKPQKGYVAYSMVDHPENLVSDYFGTNVNTPEKLISYIVAGCDNGRKDCGHKCEWQEDNTYSREWQTMEDLNNDGRYDPDEWVHHREDGLPGVYNFFFYGTKDEHLIYVTWVGEDGNFHEPFAWDPTNDVEVDIQW